MTSLATDTPNWGHVDSTNPEYQGSAPRPAVPGDPRPMYEAPSGAQHTGQAVPGGVRVGQWLHAVDADGKQVHRTFLIGYLRDDARPLPPQIVQACRSTRYAHELPRLHHPDQDAAHGEDGRGPPLESERLPVYGSGTAAVEAGMRVLRPPPGATR